MTRASPASIQRHDGGPNENAAQSGNPAACRERQVRAIARPARARILLGSGGMTLLEILIILVFLAIINIAMVVGRIWGVDVGVVIGAAPVVLWIAGLAASDLVRWHRRRPKPLPRAMVVRPRAS
ncbi:MAG: hypothetical protein ABI678_15720 [Kofleriaceae bacterium]